VSEKKHSLAVAVIPPFHDTIDKAVSYLADEGLVGVADFYVSAKWDLPLRQMPWIRRFFWRYAVPAVSPLFDSTPNVALSCSLREICF
jgi:hypothetical protein